MSFWNDCNWFSIKQVGLLLTFDPILFKVTFNIILIRFVRDKDITLVHLFTSELKLPYQLKLCYHVILFLNFYLYYLFLTTIGFITINQFLVGQCPMPMPQTEPIVAALICFRS